MRRRAFTLIELLVVIAIIGILAAMIQPGLTAANEYARLMLCRSRLAEMGMALRLYMQDWEAPPEDLETLCALGYLEDDTVLQCSHAQEPFEYHCPDDEAAANTVVAACPNRPHGGGRSGAVLHLNSRVVVDRVPGP